MSCSGPLLICLSAAKAMDLSQPVFTSLVFATLVAAGLSSFGLGVQAVLKKVPEYFASMLEMWKTIPLALVDGRQISTL